MSLKKVTVTARKTEGPSKAKQLSYIRVELADNGCIVEADYRLPREAMTEKNMYMPPPSERQVFKDPKEAGAYVTKLLGGAGKKEDAAHEGGESKAEEKAEQDEGDEDEG